MALKDLALRNAKPKDRTYTLSDGGALYLYVTPSGAKLWRYRFRWLDKQQIFSIGKYPQVSLSEARKARDQARALLQQSKHPTQQRHLQRIALAAAQSHTFESIAREYLDSNSKRWSKLYASQATQRFEADVFPKIGRLPIGEVTPVVLLDLLRSIEKRGAVTVAVKLRIWIGSVFRYAIAIGRVATDPTYALRDAIHVKPTNHSVPVEKKDIPRFIQNISELQRENLLLGIGLKLLLLTMVRGGELRSASWSEFDWDDRTWRIPAERMKMKQAHIVPLSTQSIVLLKRLQQEVGSYPFLFPSFEKENQPISAPMWGKAVEKVRCSPDITPHSFRATASTLLNELGYQPDWIERQLAHVPRNRTRASYNHAQYLPERTRMIQEWADFLDQLSKDKGGLSQFA